PQAKQWSDSWQKVEIEAMLSPSLNAMLANDPPAQEELDSQLPGITNPQVSLHRLYYLLW
ncbi:hypothetical protein CROQUDRAFT_44440, partial [Cronartium quercuum f. sp. fusiforme G11]